MIVYRARWVLPIASPPINDGAVAVDTGRITYVGPDHSAPNGERRDLGDCLLLPGLVNVHTHLELTAMRGFLEALPFAEWILTLTRARSEVLSKADLLDAARAGIVEGLAAGITTYADTCESGVVLTAMRELGVRGIMYQEVFGPDPAVRDQLLRDLEEKVALLRPLASDLVQLGVSPHAPYSVSAELMRAVGELARREGLPCAIHIAESDEEFQFVYDGAGPWADSHRRRDIPVKSYSSSPLQYLGTTGVLAARPLLIHCVRVDAPDLDLIADADCAVAHCPISNAKLGHGIAPLTDFLRAGIRVGLGSDSVASNNRMDLIDEARAALLGQRVRLGSPDVLDASRVLELATIGGARALGIASSVGTLEPGKEADLAAFPLGSPRAVPGFDPADMLVHAVGSSPAALVTVQGRELVRDGRVLADDTALRARVSDAADRLVRWRARAR